MRLLEWKEVCRRTRIKEFWDLVDRRKTPRRWHCFAKHNPGLDVDYFGEMLDELFPDGGVIGMPTAYGVFYTEIRATAILYILKGAGVEPPNSDFDLEWEPGEQIVMKMIAYLAYVEGSDCYIISKDALTILTMDHHHEWRFGSESDETARLFADRVKFVEAFKVRVTSIPALRETKAE